MKIINEIRKFTALVMFAVFAIAMLIFMVPAVVWLALTNYIDVKPAEDIDFKDRLEKMTRSIEKILEKK